MLSQVLNRSESSFHGCLCRGEYLCVIFQNHRHGCRVLKAGADQRMSRCQVLIIRTKVFVQGAGVIPNEVPALVQITANWLSVEGC